MANRMPPDPRKVPKMHGRMPASPAKVPRVKPRPVAKPTPKARQGKSLLAKDSSGCAVTALALAGGLLGTVGFGVVQLMKAVV